MLEAQIKWNETNSKTIIILLSFFMFVYVSTGEKYYIYIILLLSYRRNRNELWFVFFGYEVILDWETLSESQFVALFELMLFPIRLLLIISIHFNICIGEIVM